MGNTQTKNSNSSNSNQSKSSNKVETQNDDLLLIENITNISNELFQLYNENFLNKKFCNNLSVIYEKNLANLKLKTLKTQYQNIQSEEDQPEFQTFLAYNPPETQKFIVNELRGELNEHFFRKYIEVNKELFTINEPYINKKTLDFLHNYKKKVKQNGGNDSNLNKLLLSIKKQNQISNQNRNKLKKEKIYLKKILYKKIKSKY